MDWRADIIEIFERPRSGSLLAVMLEHEPPVIAQGKPAFLANTSVFAVPANGRGSVPAPGRLRFQ
ncbi:MAG: hypothetical protein H0V62_07075 [Gammaproteobacteria bacterium]|nr:hypothetical protein [Gammaproteobacteria bacterium]MBA3732197.1 hypothetical protein [Gammaproteobacteria bacterium]